MRIAFLTTEFVTEPNFPGGLSNYLLQVCLALKEFHHHPIVFVPSSRNEILYHQGIEVVRIERQTPFFIKFLDRLTLCRFSHPLSVISSALILSRTLKKYHQKTPFDIVQAASFKATNLFLNNKIPTVIRISSYEPLLRKAYRKPFTFSQIIFEWLEAFAIKKAHNVFAPSKLIAKEINRLMNLPVKVLESPFILDTPDFDWSSYDRHLKNKTYLLFIGTVGLLKGCKVIADIIESLLLKNPELFFVFIGQHTFYNGEKMMNYILKKSNSVRDRVLYFEPTKHKALYPIIRKAHCVILPSIVDNFPNACLESMSLGQVVVGTEGTSLEQMIEDGVSGFLCAPNNPDSLSKAIDRVLNLSKYEKDILSKNAKSAMERVAPRRVVKDLVDYYISTIQKAKNKENAL